MAKMKISELAQQLKGEGHSVESKDIIKALDELNIKNNDKKFVSASNIDDDIIARVKKHLTGKKNAVTDDNKKREVKAEVKTAAAAAKPVAEIKTVTAAAKPTADAPKALTSMNKEAAPAAAEARSGEVKPKKKISVVFNPQNSSQPNRLPRPERPDQRDKRHANAPAGDARNVRRPEGIRQDKTDTLRQDRPETMKQDRTETVKRPEVRTERPDNNRPDVQRRQEAQRPDRTGDFRRPEGQRRADGQRAERNDNFRRNDGPRGDRPEGQRRADGQRAERNDNFRRNDGPRGDRPEGQRRPDGQRSDRTGDFRRNDGQRPERNNDFRKNDNQKFDRNDKGDNNFRRNDGRDGGRGDNRDRRNDGRNDKKMDIKLDTPIERKPEARSEKRLEKRPERTNRDDKRQEGKLEIKQVKKTPAPQPKPKEEDEIKVIVLPEKVTIKELAEKMKMQPSVLVKQLFMKGQMVTINQEVDFETAEEIALEYEIICEKEVVVDVIEELLKEDEENEADMVPRPPVVCVMGHVDHGKTSLLDAIRSTNVISREAGGITQHIGAYMVEINGQKITFLDTPGHEAFTAMRMRGAKSTDIAILVVAADDGVMPQTIEAINHAKAAGVEIIVAINKIDKPSANIERVKQELTEHELIAEDWGGSTVFVPVSAHTKEGIENLLEMILLTAELKELKANPKRNARGLVIEAQLDKGKGAVATVLVQKGTLRVGDSIAVGPCHGKIRAMIDDKGRRVKEATPSTPVEILGLNDVPNAGDIFVITANEKEARNFAETFIAQNKEKLIEETKAKLSLDALFSQIQAGNVKELNIIVKADVQGSVEAVKQSLTKLSNEEVVVKVIHGGVGAINESDVILASASNAIIIGFNVRPDNMAKATADRENVDVRLYRVIYQAIEDVEAAMKGMLEPIYVEKVIAHAEVRATFKASGIGVIAGSYVLDGKITRGCKARITRDGALIFDGLIASMKHLKDDVKEVRAGFECGLVFEKFSDLAEGDQIEAYIMEEVPR